MTTMVPDVVLDERTRAELAPPCEAADIMRNRHCDAAAEWVLALSCGCTTPPVEHYLLCAAHTETVLAAISNGRAAGVRCKQRLRVETLERLR